MRVDAAEAGPLRGGGHNLRRGGGAQRSQRSKQTNEDGVPQGAGRPLAEVRGNRVAHVCREGHALDSVSLAVDDDLAGAPPQVVEPQVRQFGNAQAETGQRGDDGKVAAPCEGSAVAGGKQALDVIGIEARRQLRQSTAGH